MAVVRRLEVGLHKPRRLFAQRQKMAAFWYTLMFGGVCSSHEASVTLLPYSINTGIRVYPHVHLFVNEL